MMEEWRDVPGLEGAYEVSSLGRLRSVDRVAVGRDGKSMNVRGRVRRQARASSGYLSINASVDGVKQTVYAHQAVARAFLADSMGDGPFVLHGPGGSQDNRVQNLRWGTSPQNAMDSVREGTHRNARKQDCPQGHPLMEPNLRPNKIRVGQRECLACARAKDYMRRHPHLDFAATADDYYRKLIPA